MVKVEVEINNQIWDMLVEMADKLRTDPIKILQQEIDELMSNIEAWTERAIMISK